MSSRPGLGDRGGDGFAAARRLARRPGRREDRAADAAGSSLRGLSSVTIAVGEPRGDRAHHGALADVAVAAGAEDDDQPALGVRAERVDGGLDRVGRVGVIDIDRRAGAGDYRPFEAAADRLHPARDGRGRARARRPWRSPGPAAVSAFAA